MVARLWSGAPYRSPDKWFGDAFAAGLGIELELAVLEITLEEFEQFPPDVYLSLNASPETILSGALSKLLAKKPLKRLVLEITEHAPVADYMALMKALHDLRANGLRLAVDDAGAGYASLKHIVRLKPDIIKLDMSLTRCVDSDPALRALASALIYFARETDCVIIAEGIETVAEMEALKLLGVPRGQGYFLGQPADLATTQALLLQYENRRRA